MRASRLCAGRHVQPRTVRAAGARRGDRAALPHPFEILISEDCSTDGTREIVQEYAERHPHLVRLLLSERNLHSNEVVARFAPPAGRYVALLDGDDYWTSDDKLQAQVAFLDARPDLTICFHNAQVVDERSQRSGRLWNAPGQPEVGARTSSCAGTSSPRAGRAPARRSPRFPPGTTASSRSRTGRCTSSTPARVGSATSTERSAPTACTPAGGSRRSASAKQRRTPTSTGRGPALSRALEAEVARGQCDYFLGWAGRVPPAR